MWKNLIVCDGTSTDPCTYKDLWELAVALINNMVVISTFLAVAVFAYAGFLLVTSGGSESQKSKATAMLWKVLKGYLWILVAWIVVYTITKALLNAEFIILTPR